jgi:hypothetical protein
VGGAQKVVDRVLDELLQCLARVELAAAVLDEYRPSRRSGEWHAGSCAFHRYVLRLPPGYAREVRERLPREGGSRWKGVQSYRSPQEALGSDR